jgi:hypothetical protein
MRWRVVLAAVLATALLPPVPLPASEGVGDAHEALGAARGQLLESTRAYRASLERLIVLQREAAARAELEASQRRILLEQGIVSRRESEESARSAAATRDRLEETRQRLAETDAVLAETLAAMELARSAPPSGKEVVVSTAHAIGAPGKVDLTTSIVTSLDQFFRGRFARALPMSARGQTPVHDRLGLDHHHAVDVAVHPDSAEGWALIEHLRLLRVPFMAFRSMVPGSSTGAHLHIGRASRKLAPAGSWAAEPAP